MNATDARLTGRGRPPRDMAPEPVGDASARESPTTRQRLGTFAFAVLVGALVWSLWPVPFGGATSYTIVAGHSMDPTYHTGDLAMGRATDRIEVGDVIAYRVPAGEPGEGKAVIHRVVGGDGVQGYTTKGDNSPRPDIWHPTQEDVVGRAVVLIPRGGVVLRWVFSPIALAAVASALLMWALWPRRCKETAGEGSEGAGRARATAGGRGKDRPVGA